MTPDGRLGVVTLVDRLVHGGAERLAAEIATRLDPERFASTLCVTRWSDPAHARSPEVAEQARTGGRGRRRAVPRAHAARPLGPRGLGTARAAAAQRRRRRRARPHVRLERVGGRAGPADRRPGRDRARAQLGVHRRSHAAARRPARDRPRKRCRHRVLRGGPAADDRGRGHRGRARAVRAQRHRGARAHAGAEPAPRVGDRRGCAGGGQRRGVAHREALRRAVAGRRAARGRVAGPAGRHRRGGARARAARGARCRARAGATP